MYKNKLIGSVILVGMVRKGVSLILGLCFFLLLIFCVISLLFMVLKIVILRVMLMVEGMKIRLILFFLKL